MLSELLANILSIPTGWHNFRLHTPLYPHKPPPFLLYIYMGLFRIPLVSQPSTGFRRTKVYKNINGYILKQPTPFFFA